MREKRDSGSLGSLSAATGVQYLWVGGREKAELYHITE